jgi:peptidyl-prolyl cis-trans isomerase D
MIARPRETFRFSSFLVCLADPDLSSLSIHLRQKPLSRKVCDRKDPKFMMRLLRKHRQWLMIVIAVLALPFVFYFVQKPDYGAMRRDQVAEMYGRSIQVVEFQRNARLGGLAQALGLETLWDSLSMREPKDSGYQQFAINLIVLEHEAPRFGIHPQPAEIADVVRNMPAFRGSSGFDPGKYDEFVRNVLPPNGFTEAQIEQLAGDELALKRIKELLATGVTLPETEVKSDYEDLYGKNIVSVIRVHMADFDKDVKVADDEVQKYYDSHKAELKTEEKRKVDFVQFTLTDDQKKLPSRERVDVLRKLQDRADDFTQALEKKGADFRQVAAQLKLPLEETGEFTATSPDPKLKGNPKLSAAAFQLTPQEPNSDIIEKEDGYYVLHLVGITPSRPLTLEEAKPKIVDELKTAQERQLVQSQGAKAVHDLREDLNAGKPLSFALEQANVKAEKLEPFTVADNSGMKPAAEKANKEPADMMEIRSVTAELQPGEVSDFYPSSDGGLIVYLEKREPPDQAEYSRNKAEFDQRYLRNKRELVFYEWLRDQQLAANVQFAKS